jgi:hypothetical protein
MHWLFRGASPCARVQVP